MHRRQHSISINGSDDGIFGRCVILPRKAADFEFYERSFQDAIRYYKFRWYDRSIIQFSANFW